MQDIAEAEGGGFEQGRGITQGFGKGYGARHDGKDGLHSSLVQELVGGVQAADDTKPVFVFAVFAVFRSFSRVMLQSLQKWTSHNNINCNNCNIYNISDFRGPLGKRLIAL